MYAIPGANTVTHVFVISDHVGSFDERCLKAASALDALFTYIKVGHFIAKVKCVSQAKSHHHQCLCRQSVSISSEDSSISTCIRAKCLSVKLNITQELKSSEKVV